MSDRSSPSPPGTLDRGLSILELVASMGEVSVASILENLPISRSATYRLVDRLVEAGYLAQVPDSDTYRLGMSAVKVGIAAVRSLDIVRMAPKVLEPLAQETGETSFLAVFDHDAMVYMEKAEGSQSIRLMTQLGARGAMHSTSLGKAFLSALDDEETSQIMGRLRLTRATENTIRDVTALAAEITRTRERGYAVDMEENEQGVVCVGAAIRDYLGRPVAAISVSGPKERVLPSHEAFGGLVADAALKASESLGFEPGG